MRRHIQQSFGPEIFLPVYSKHKARWLYNLGFEDAISFIESRGIPDSPLARPHLSEVPRNVHNYDVRSRVSMHRFLGYNHSDVTHHSVAFAMDLVLLIFFVLLWKPLSIVSIYTELLLHCLIDTVYIVAAELWSIGLCLLIASLTLTPISLPLLALFLLIAYTKTLAWGLSKTTLKAFANLTDCVLCIFSLSLFLRFFSGPPSTVKLRKHNRLQRVSLLYRVFHHIM